MIVHAMQSIVNRFYTKHTPTIFITVRSSGTVKNGWKPEEIAGEIIRIGSDHTSMAYVIENNITSIFERYNRRFNVFLIDSYESFK